MHASWKWLLECIDCDSLINVLWQVIFVLVTDLLFSPSEDSDGNIVEEVVVGPVPKQQVTLSKKDYGKVSPVVFFSYMTGIF